MKLHFISTAEDNADCDFRKIKSSPVYNQNKFLNLFFQGSTIFLFLQFLNLNGATLIVIVYVIYYLVTYDKNLFESLKKDFEALTGKEGIKAHYEITEDKLIYRRSGFETHLLWSSFEKFVENKKDVEVHFQKGMTVVYHFSIFSSDEERKNWIQAIKEKTKKM